MLTKLVFTQKKATVCSDALIIMKFREVPLTAVAAASSRPVTNGTAMLHLWRKIVRFGTGIFTQY